MGIFFAIAVTKKKSAIPPSLPSLVGLIAPPPRWVSVFLITRKAPQGDWINWRVLLLSFPTCCKIINGSNSNLKVSYICSSLFFGQSNVAHLFAFGAYSTWRKRRKKEGRRKTCCCIFLPFPSSSSSFFLYPLFPSLSPCHQQPFLFTTQFPSKQISLHPFPESKWAVDSKRKEIRIDLEVPIRRGWWGKTLGLGFEIRTKGKRTAPVGSKWFFVSRPIDQP